METIPANQPEQSTGITEAKPEKYWLFKPGNTAYNLRTKSGVAKLFETPEKFLEEVAKYFQHCNDNPWVKKEQVKTPLKPYKDEETGKTTWPSAIIDIPTQTPYSIEGLCNYLGITLQTFNNYEKKEGYNDFFEVLAYVRQIIETNQFEGGVVGAYNPAIIIRKLGLKESIEAKIEQTNRTIIEFSHLPGTIEDCEGVDITELQKRLSSDSL
jgi:hypothetical protein